ncbi:hypothetical protein ES703_59260 [subsurface metagenome]
MYDSLSALYEQRYYNKKVQQEVVLHSNLLVEQVGFEPLIEIVVCYLTPAGQSCSFSGYL